MLGSPYKWPGKMNGVSLGAIKLGCPTYNWFLAPLVEEMLGVLVGWLPRILCFFPCGF